MVPLSAEQLPVQILTVADGLSSDNVTWLFEGHSGRLWVGTGVGLSRYDGKTFRAYGARDGLSHPWISEIEQTPDGTIWVATAGGLDRMLEVRRDDGILFETVNPGGRPQAVRGLDVDSTGALWVAAGDGVWRRVPGKNEFERIAVPFVWTEGKPRAVTGIRAGSDGSVWIGSSVGLYRRRPDGLVIRYPPNPDSVVTSIGILELDDRGRVWINVNTVGVMVIDPAPAGSDHGLVLPRDAVRAVVPSERPVEPGSAVLLEQTCGVPVESITGIAFGVDGAVYLTSYKEGLFSIRGDRLRRFGTDAGFPEQQFQTIFRDAESDLWIGSGSSGLLRVSSGGFTNFTMRDGLETTSISSVLLDRSGKIVVDGFPPGNVLHRLADRRFDGVVLPIPWEANHGSWGLSQVSLQDQRGRWWIPTTRGLWRFDPVERWRDLADARPAAVYHEDDGLGGEEVFRLFEDSSGSIWAGVFGRHSVVRWDRKTGRWHSFGTRDGLPKASATAFAEDRSGAVWIGFYNGGLARYRDGSFDVFDDSNGVPPGFVFAMEVDADGRLWVGTTRGGLGRTDDPTVKQPVWRRYTTDDGLASDGVLALVGDGRGSIWIGSMNGLDRFDVESGVIEHLDTRDGLVANSIISACRDREGNLWFATGKGVSRWTPGPDRATVPPTVLIEAVLIGGVPVPVPEAGIDRVGPLRCPVGTGGIEVRFAAPCLGEGNRVRFSYQLNTRGGDAPWSQPFADGVIRLAGLGPDRYDLRVRAEFGDGRGGPEARIRWIIPPPVWRRWWFIASALAMLLGLLLFWHRVRVRRLVEVQRVREHIASDLHDEFGLSLSRISILSEVARRQTSGDGAGEELEIIGETARGLIDATSDMAWALDPSKDTLGSVIARVRRVAGDVCEGSGVRLEVDIDPRLKEIPLPSEVRRHLLLILKEAIHNALRHGHPSRLGMRVSRTHGRLVLTVEDDGLGFDPGALEDGTGHGLAGMRRRAEAAGGDLEVSSTFGGGTRVIVSLPEVSA